MTHAACNAEIVRLYAYRIDWTVVRPLQCVGDSVEAERVVGGVGVVGGMIGNSIINGKLGELIKNKNCKETQRMYNKELDSVNKWKKCLKKWR